MGKILKAAIGEGLRSCDRCGYTDHHEKFVSIYFGGSGQKVDLCPKCLRREVESVRERQSNHR
ncbi:MAG: hypothetical protein NZ931_01585 [Aigarchaeota archaeon]|nr:hypothetical protein [Aigarchaeota archaeon]